MTLAFVFPGQGSQAVGMGREIYEASPIARAVFEEVDDVLSQKLSLLIFEGSQDELTLTQNAQPALMAVSIALMRVLEKEAGLDLTQKAQFLAGHSLGEYTALCAAGALSLADTARLLRIRGQAMQEAVPVGQGAMAALLGLDLEVVDRICSEASMDQSFCVIANDNSPGQVVISGHKSAIERALSLASEQGAKRSVMLAVSAPFHSPLMKPAAEAMEKALHKVKIMTPRVPIIANMTAKPYGTEDRVIPLLVDQITGRVRWRESVLEMAQSGVHTFVEVGAGRVLVGLNKRISSEITGKVINTPDDINDFLKIRI